jgi:hypothetical protein
MTADQGDVREWPAAEAADGERIEGPTDSVPAVPDSIREAARIAPDHWLGMVDPAWTGAGEPPRWAMLGQWRSSTEGEIVEWRENEEYRPSPAALGWPEPADEVDEAVQLAATGYGPGEDVTDALAAFPEVAVFVTPEGDPLPATAPDGTTRVIPVFTAPAYLHAAGRLAFELIEVRELVERLPADHLIYLNPSAPVSMTVDTDMLRETLEEISAADAAFDEEAAEVAPRPATIGGDAPAPGERLTLPYGGL